MTQKNIDTMDIIVKELTNGKKISEALKTVYNKRSVKLPYNDDMLSLDIMKLNMSMRTTNALRRGGILTLLDAINYCKKDKITTIKNLGIHSGIELFETILDYIWSKMSDDERVAFLIDVVKCNEKNLK